MTEAGSICRIEAEFPAGDGITNNVISYSEIGSEVADVDGSTGTSHLPCSRLFMALVAHQVIIEAACLSCAYETPLFNFTDAVISACVASIRRNNQQHVGRLTFDFF